jgi:protein SCO1/2
MKSALSSLCLCLSLLAVWGCKREAELQKLYPVPDFSLTDQTEKKVTLSDLKGRVWVADFIFTNCGGICPVMTEKMRKFA